jgi:hypothetical protein
MVAAGAVSVDVSEDDFSLLLQATNVRAANAAIMNDFFIVSKFDMNKKEICPKKRAQVKF